MAVHLPRRLFRLMIDLLLIFEPLFPQFVSVSVRRQLKDLKTKGLILGYKTRVRRLGKLHYRVVVDMDLTQPQVELILREVSDRVRRIIRNGKEVI